MFILERLLQFGEFIGVSNVVSREISWEVVLVLQERSDVCLN